LPEADIGVDGGELLAELGALLPRYVGFFVSFVEIGNLRLGHHRMFRMVRAYDEPLTLERLGVLNHFGLEVPSVPSAMEEVSRRMEGRSSSPFHHHQISAR
jgi:hypothetical protein